ncbi:MAG: MmgE/PrpD family protein [Euzebya sp.]
METAIIGFIHGVDARDLPASVHDQLRRCLLDLIAVSAAGTQTRVSQIIRTHAARHHGVGEGTGARLLFDGRRVSPAGAALANAATIDGFDGHDGHRLTKGHAGAAVLPAALAFLDEHPDADMDQLLVALAIGYELGTRAGITLHATAGDYHSSGAWNAVACAAIGARVMGLDHAATAHALGIAEYHAPRAPMMRCIQFPSMVKDSSGWGSFTGVTSALLAADGFTGPPPALLEGSAEGPWADLGRRWLVLDQYFKPFPVCRWAHPAIFAALEVMRRDSIDAHRVDTVEVRTFDPAIQLDTRLPDNTEQAQYSLPFPVAVAIVRGEVDPAIVTDPATADDRIRRLSAQMVVQEDPAMTSGFPASRQADVTVVLSDGTRHASGPLESPGDPEWPLSNDELDAKFMRYCDEPLGTQRARRLLAAARHGDGPLRDGLADLWSPTLPPCQVSHDEDPGR